MNLKSTHWLERRFFLFSALSPSCSIERNCFSSLVQGNEGNSSVKVFLNWITGLGGDVV